MPVRCNPRTPLKDAPFAVLHISSIRSLVAERTRNREYRTASGALSAQRADYIRKQPPGSEPVAYDYNPRTPLKDAPFAVLHISSIRSLVAERTRNRECRTASGALSAQRADYIRKQPPGSEPVAYDYNPRTPLKDAPFAVLHISRPDRAPRTCPKEQIRISCARFR